VIARCAEGEHAAEDGSDPFHALHRLFVAFHTLLKLADAARLAEAHISNFLNKKRSLSLEGLDRVLAAQNLTVDQLLPVDLNAGSMAAGDPMEIIPVVSSSAAMESAFATASSVIETVQVSASRLQGNRPRPVAKRSHWQRFVAIRADAQQASAMEPILTAGTIAVLDRHYN
jgi:transcriptional regulator with XRE-family HTH domain